MTERALFQKVDAVTVPVPDLDAGLRFYAEALGHQLKWRNDELGQAGLRLPGGDTELVLATERVREAGGRIVHEPFDIAVGRAVVVADPFGNVLLLLDLSKGLYQVDESGAVTGVGDGGWMAGRTATARPGSSGSTPPPAA